ncbi:hypothetical protein NC652_021211 [Populus alba x Populus x berolinensis]|nr:hypothetical protein NC652_021211 [Populus alba x Populus x berolinensis]
MKILFIKIQYKIYIYVPRLASVIGVAIVSKIEDRVRLEDDQ